MNFYRLFKFTTLGSNIPAWYAPTSHDQIIFIIYDSAGRDRTKPI